MAKRRISAKEKERVAEVLNRLDMQYGTEYRCYLDHENPWQLLVATILSAQCTDARVNIVTKDLFVKYPDVEVETIPGVSAVLSGAAVLGAALMHDFAVISLSDWLTPWEKIEKRIAFAAQADFVMCFYNPSSHVRKDYLKKACEILLQYISPETVCGIVKNIGREGQEAIVLPLGELKDTPVDMFSTVFIGNSQTMKLGDKMVTPRGYKHE